MGGADKFLGKKGKKNRQLYRSNIKRERGCRVVCEKYQAPTKDERKKGEGGNASVLTNITSATKRKKSRKGQ